MIAKRDRQPESEPGRGHEHEEAAGGAEVAPLQCGLTPAAGDASRANASGADLPAITLDRQLGRPAATDLVDAREIWPADEGWPGAESDIAALCDFFDPRGGTFWRGLDALLLKRARRQLLDERELLVFKAIEVIADRYRAAEGLRRGRPPECEVKRAAGVLAAQNDYRSAVNRADETGKQRAAQVLRNHARRLTGDGRGPENAHYAECRAAERVLSNKRSLLEQLGRNLSVLRHVQPNGGFITDNNAVVSCKRLPPDHPAFPDKQVCTATRMTSYRVRVPGWQQLLREWEHECATLAQEIPPLEIEVARLRKLVDQEADEFLDFYIPATTEQ